MLGCDHAETRCRDTVMTGIERSPPEVSQTHPSILLPLGEAKEEVVVSVAMLDKGTRERLGELASSPLDVPAADAISKALTAALRSSRSASRAGGASTKASHQSRKGQRS